jgi:hypothetical protein
MEREKALLLHDGLLQKLNGAARPVARTLLMIAARSKRTFLKSLDTIKAKIR